VQASVRSWTPPAGTLGRLVAEAHNRAAALAPRLGELERAASFAPPPPSFAAALRRPSVAVVAEVKRRSPSKGAINPGLATAGRAAAYAAGGAAALSILTEPASFGGSDDDLAAARRAVELPLLRKDFHVAPVQLVQARALGASSALLIARALAPSALREMAAIAADLGLDALIEVRDEEELRLALETGAPAIGVNNRDLETLHVDQRTGERLIPAIPADRVAIFESGVAGVDDVRRAASAGADAVLVGSSLSAAADPTAAVRALAGVPRTGRGR
jgi:indole-3-glycerol phosphate synthase